MKRRRDFFPLVMLAAVAVAWRWPGPGTRDGWMHPELVTKLGVALLFFLHGAGLSFAAFKEGMFRWRLHLVTQGCIFLFWPLLGLGLLWVAGDAIPPWLRVGFFFLCALPSTVSSSIGVTAMAGGNVPAAVFNATLSNTLGVFLTPLWLGLVLHVTGPAQPLGLVILRLFGWLVLPLFIGQVGRRWLGPWLARHPSLGYFVDRTTILFVIYTSFCDSVKQGVWSEHGGSAFLMTLAGVAGLFVVVMLALNLAARLWRFTRADRVTAMVCGSTKAIGAGVSIAQIVFGGHPGAGFILLPIMIYHPFQLFMSSLLAQRWGKATARETGSVGNETLSAQR